MSRCPDCKNEFMQPFVCTTCGAEKLYDETLKSATEQLAAARQRIAELEQDVSNSYKFNSSHLLEIKQSITPTVKKSLTVQWVGLTGDEISQIGNVVGFEYIDVARYVEAKLKEKNK